VSPRQIALYAALYVFENAAYRIDRALDVIRGRTVPLTGR
jgi:hypothetical protein